MRTVAAAAAVSVALVVAYLALGGASYAPAQVADPCVARDWRDPRGVEAVVEQIVLSGLDGAACELGVTREEMVLALSNAGSREQFAQDHGISNERLEELVREGVLRAIEDAEEADALNSTVAGILRRIAERIPVDELLDLLDDLPTF